MTSRAERYRIKAREALAACQDEARANLSHYFRREAEEWRRLADMAELEDRVDTASQRGETGAGELQPAASLDQLRSSGRMSDRAGTQPRDPTQRPPA
jgi:hypothetical protein